jgi:hypothetical protein
MCEKSVGRLAGIVVAAICSLPSAHAQIVSGSIVGRLVDPSGASVPGAALSLTNSTTGLERRAASDGEGGFLFAGLDGGVYHLKVESKGFKSLERRDINLPTGERISLGQLTLELGSTAETVTITASPNLVQTASADRGDIITGQQIEGILVKGRNVTDLLQLVPGVLLESTQEALSGSVTMYVQGNRSTTNNISIDGVLQTDLGSAGSIRTPMSMDAVGEVKVMISNYQAEHGRMGGSNVEIVTKSGTRDFHGTGSYFMRREWMNANTFFNNRNGQPKPRSRYNTISYNIGGPVYIPRVFNRERQKLFFFWNQEFWPNKSTSNGRVTVPTAAERIGDFSQSTQPNGAAIPVRDPFNNNLQFPGNAIPRSRIDPNGQALLAMLPEPNFTNRAVSLGAYNYVFGVPIDNPQRTTTLRIDFNPNTSNFITGSYSGFSNPQFGSQGVGNNANWPMLALTLDSAPKTASIRYTRIFSPKVINEFKVGGLTSPVDARYTQDQIRRVQRDTVGFRAGQRFPAANPLNVIPNASFGGISNAANLSIEARFPRYNRYQVLSFSDNITWSQGAHIIKAGWYYEYFHRIQKASTGSPPFNGSFDFGINANNPLNTNYAYGNAILGVYNTYTEASSPIWMHVSMANNHAFIQDTWRPFSRLTVDYGVRFYWISPLTDRDDLMGAWVSSRYDPAQAMRLIRPGLVGGVRVGVNPATGETYPQATIGAIAPGAGKLYNGMVFAYLDKDYPRGMVKPSGTQVAPRVGFAWDVFGNGSTAVRGGFGMAYSGYLTEGFGNFFVRQPPLTQTPVSYYGQIAQLLSATGFLFPSANTYAVDPAGTVPRLMNYSFSVQRKLPSGAILDVAYAGSLGRHLQWNRNINSVPLGSNFLAPNLDPTQSNRPLPANFLRPLQGYGPLNVFEMASSSNYHSMQVSARRRFTRSVQFGAAWTWSKAMDFNDTETSAVTVLAPLRAWHYGLAGFDRTHIVRINYLVNLPNAPVHNRVLRGALHGWELSGITSFISGAPLGVGFTTTTAIDITGTPDLGARIVTVGSPVLPKSERTFSRYFDTSVFRLPPVGSLGTAGKTVLRGPGTNNWDTALAKTFRLYETLRMQFRCEAYNAFNHTQFSAVNTTAQFNPATGAQTNPSFGQITAARNPRTVQLALRVMF